MKPKNAASPSAVLPPPSVASSLPSVAIPPTCAVTKVPFVIAGVSLSGLVEDGASVTLLRGYYTCHPVTRNDIVAYLFGGGTKIFAKIVKGLPGDRLGLEQVGDGWHILINGKAVVNAQGEPYVVSQNRSVMIRLYVDSYHGIIPSDAYLLLGNDPAGTLDSTRFGLVGSQDIVGKFEIN